MSRSLRPRCFRQAGLAAAFLALLPGSALAADAPLRFIGVDPSGARVWNIHWVAASEDAHELIGTQIADGNGFGDAQSSIVDRNVVTGKTTALTGQGYSLVAASTDLRTLLVRTSKAVSPKDTDGTTDYYSWNRDTGKITLISANADGTAIGNGADVYQPTGQAFDTVQQPALSGDGSVAQFMTTHMVAGDDDATSAYFRVNTATGVRTQLPDPGDGITYETSMDDAGHVAVTENAIYVDGVKKASIPSQVWPVVISPDGGYAAALDYENRVFGIDLKTGQATPSVALPSYNNGREYPTLRYVENGGKSVIFDDLLTTGSDGDRLAFGRVDSNGNVSQIGGGIRISDWEFLNGDYTGARVGPLGEITRNGQFAFTGLSLAQLGSTPLPGSDPATPSPAQIGDYLFTYDTTCTLSGFLNLFRTYSTPTTTLAIRPQRADVRRPVSFTGTVTKTATGATIQSLTLAPGKPTNLNGLGVNGGWQINGTLKFSDGTSINGSQVVASHASPTCTVPSYG